MSSLDRDDFTLKDVQAEVQTGSATLADIFSKADGLFDPMYVGDKDRLYNFRNYIHDKIPTPPTNLVASNITSTTFYLSWTAPPFNVTEYRVYRNGVQYKIVAGNNMSTMLSGLERATAASWTVVAINNAGGSANSQALVVTTLRTLVQLYDNSASDNLEETCSYTSGPILEVYHDGSGSSPVDNDYLWDDPVGGHSFSGDNDYWKKSGGSGVLEVSGTGRIYEVYSCS